MIQKELSDTMFIFPDWRSSSSQMRNRGTPTKSRDYRVVWQKRLTSSDFFCSSSVGMAKSSTACAIEAPPRATSPITEVSTKFLRVDESSVYVDLWEGLTWKALVLHCKAAKRVSNFMVDASDELIGTSVS